MFRSCLPYYFEGIGVDFDVSNDTSSVLANLTYDLISIYIDTEFIDSSFETLNLLFRDILTWMIETDSSIVDNDDIKSLLDTTIGWCNKYVSDQNNYTSGGFCYFAVRNLLAAHGLGSYAFENVGNGIDSN